MTTEMRNPDTMELDAMSPLEIITAMNREDKTIPDAVGEHLAEIAGVVEWGIRSLQQKGNLNPFAHNFLLEKERGQKAQAR